MPTFKKSLVISPKSPVNLGFTLIEMLIVMAMIALLATLFITGFPASQRRARDAQRRSDLNNYNALLREYGSRHEGLYPGANGSGIEMKCGGMGCIGLYLCNLLGISSTACHVDRYDRQTECFNNELCIYYYQGSSCDDGSACAESFVLRARLESEAGWVYYCSNGSNGIAAEGTTWDTLAGYCPI